MTAVTTLAPIQAPDQASPAPARRRLNVAIVDEELPYPPTSGKRIRTLNLTLRLARRHNITYLCHLNQDPREARRAAAYFAGHGIATVVVDRPVPAKSGPAFFARLAANLFSRLPYSVATHTSRALGAALSAHAATGRVDLWHCEWTPYAEALRVVGVGRRLVMAHNVESVIWRRYYENEANPLKRWYIGRQWRKYERFERRVLGEVDRTVAVSSEDAALLRNEFGARRVGVVENGVDTAYFRPRDARREPGRLLFLGSLDWRPNLDGVRLLLERVFPAVRAAEPSATLWVVGRNPPDWLRRQAGALPGVELHGSVPDVRPFLDRCALMVVPLRIGGGSRLKILEALSSSTPVVSTRVGAEGLCLEGGRHLTVVETIDGLAPALLAALRDPDALRAQADEGRRRVLRQYDWDGLADELERIWIDCAAEAAVG
jgi:glycosyltransferase involved in cell wall biosynthesis